MPGLFLPFNRLGLSFFQRQEDFLATFNNIRRCSESFDFKAKRVALVSRRNGTDSFTCWVRSSRLGFPGCLT